MTEVPVTNKTALGGLNEINRVIDAKVQQKMRSDGSISYAAALVAVATAEPDLFLTRARLELDAAYRNQTIYFDYINGQLVNPAVMQGGKMMPVPTPLDTTPINPNISPDQELAIRVASKMARVAASEGRRLTYSKALRLVGSENPNLLMRQQRTYLR